MKRKRCAVCGDRCETNVRLAWRRDSDGKTVNVCMACAEENKVNAESIDNFKTSDTVYRGFKSSVPRNTTIGHMVRRVGNRP